MGKSLIDIAKEVIQTETQSYFRGFQKNKTKKEILGNFDEVLKKIGKRKVPDWDKI